jgi:hypothetical protein
VNGGQAKQKFAVTTKQQHGRRILKCVPCSVIALQRDMHATAAALHTSVLTVCAAGCIACLTRLPGLLLGPLRCISRNGRLRGVVGSNLSSKGRQVLQESSGTAQQQQPQRSEIQAIFEGRLWVSDLRQSTQLPS